MKKLLLASNLLLIGIIFFMGCNNNKPNPDSPKDNYANHELGGLVDDSIAVVMSKLYKDDFAKSHVNGDKDRLDARSIWFSLEKLKTFIAKIEASTTVPESKLGIRFYYAKYPDSPGFGNVAGMHTLFMSPTFRNEKGDIDFDFENVGRDRANPTPYAELLGRHRMGAGTKNGLMSWAAEPLQARAGTIPRVDNHGGLMPPPAEKGSFPTGE